MSRSCPKLSLVVPCFNEEQMIAETIVRLKRVLSGLIDKGEIQGDSAIYFIDDGSTDRTWEIISESGGGLVKGVRLSRNYGHQLALLAGLNHVSGNTDCAISIDADLQQDEAAIPLFIDKYKSGADIVFGVREDRKTDGIFKKWTALLFYKLMEYMGTPLIRNHADYRLTSDVALHVLGEYSEANVFLRGVFADMGLQRDYVTFSVKEREAGESKYTFRKMVSFALHGISSFSVAPLRIISLLGIVIFGASALMGLYILMRNLLVGDTVPGWASTTLPIYFIGGLQMLSIGVIGEYVGNIYTQTKARPRYIVRGILD